MQALTLRDRHGEAMSDLNQVPPRVSLPPKSPRLRPQQLLSDPVSAEFLLLSYVHCFQATRFPSSRVQNWDIFISFNAFWSE